MQAVVRPAYEYTSMLKLRLSLNPKEWRMRLALGYIMDARAGRELRRKGLDGWKYRLYVISTLPVYNYFLQFLAHFMMMLSVFEPAPGDPHGAATFGTHFGIHKSLYVELSCLILFFGDLCLRLYEQPKMWTKKTVLYAIVLSLLLTDWAMAVALPRANVVRILRCLRPLLYFFTEMKHTGTLFMTYFLTLSSSIHIIVTIFFVFLVAFALLGVLAFRDWDAAANYAGMDSISAAQGAVFQEFFTAFQGLYVLLCSNENWPTIFYEVPQWVNTSQYLADDSFVEIETRDALGATAVTVASRVEWVLRGGIGIFFILLLFLSLFFILAIVIALFYEGHKEHRRNFALRKRIAERLCLTAAFNMLDADNSGASQTPPLIPPLPRSLTPTTPTSALRRAPVRRVCGVL